MILILSDLHFGKSSVEDERAKEADVVSLIRLLRPKIKQLCLLGDVFDHFVEYEHSIPKGFSRFLGTLAELADDGIEITYYLGNHDPWHIDYFGTEFNATIVEDARIEHIGDQSIFMTHGDGKARSSGMYSILKPILRHPLPTTLYRYLLPGDTGIRLARWSSRRFSAKETNMETVSLMRQYAIKKLGNGADIVVMGHCHHAELTTFPDGLYLNTGSWHDDRTFATINDSVSLCTWDGSSVTNIEAKPLAQHR
ncbi:MAG: UDP-2,3-diacylglucosamine diphosphatase [Rhodothermales bacterium]|nr:UDP-2,3-diacylglucosamine diphosphatase [Rhodothermales bacterium]